MEVVNINKKHFLMIGSSFGVPWFFLGSSLVFYREGIREVQRKRILRKVLFYEKYPNEIRDKLTKMNNVPHEMRD